MFKFENLPGKHPHQNRSLQVLNHFHPEENNVKKVSRER